MKADKRAVYLPSASPDVTLEDVRNFLRSYRRLILACILVFLILATLYCIIATRRYASVGQVEIQKSEISSLDSLGSSTGATEAAPSDSLDFTLGQETQVEILQSDTLILQVIRELDLEPTHDFFPQGGGEIGIPAWVTFWKPPLEPLSVPLDQAPNRRALALERFNKRLKVKMVPGTRLISVTYYNPDPKLAADVVNHLMAAYIDFGFEARLKETQQASEWLTGQLSDLKKQTEDLEAKAIELQRQTGLFGEDEAHNVVLARLETLNAEVTAAESNRILKGAIYKEAQNGNAELISGLNGNSMSGTAAPNQNSLALIQSLRTQEATVRAQLADFSSRYGPDHPKMVQLRAQLNDLESGIKQEDQRIADRAKSDYEVALQQEEQSRRNLALQKSTANELNDKSTAYALAKQEADDSRTLYGTLLDKLKQAGVLQGLKASNVVIVDPGRIPSSGDPAKPNLLLIYGLAVGAGIFLGFVWALWLYVRGLRFQSIAEVSRIPGVHVEGVLPAAAPGGGLVRRTKLYLGLPVKPTTAEADGVAILDQGPEFLEGMLALRTSILLPSEGRVPQVVLITSPLSAEGASAISTALAELLARTGARTLYVDGNLRNSSPSSSKDGGARLTDLLAADKAALARPIAELRPNLFRVDAGSAVPSSAPDWLSSGRLRELLQKWRSEYQFIIIDVPAALPVVDATIVSQFSDLVLLVVRHGWTTRQMVERVQSRLLEALPPDAKIGLVFSGVPRRSLEYSDYYGSDGRKGEVHA